MTEPSQFINDEVGVVNSIMLWRIYDVLLLLLDPQVAKRVSEVHAQGEFLGPNPSFRLPGSENA